MRKLYFVISISLGLFIFGLIPQSRGFFYRLIYEDSRSVLAKVEGDLTGKGDRVHVIKVKSDDELVLEVYFFQNPQEPATEMRRIILSEKRDAFMDFKGSTTNLALIDVNEDGIQEIITPTFDENLIPRLNVYQIDLESRVFQKLGPRELQL
ncbi:MAG: hypothetical protein LW875_03270 [Proteobacteria bacterium]|nr:hypothetical protein [Pseudomonadota bacterium]